MVVATWLAMAAQAGTLQTPMSIVPGSQATFTYVDGVPGQLAGLVRGGSGLGPCPAALGGLCLSVTNPTLVDTAVVDAAGRATLRLNVPAGAPLGFGRFQAAETGASPAVGLVSVVPLTASPGDDCTTFDLTEDPISEGGLWVQQGGLSGLDWTNVQTAGGVAFGTQTGSGGYDDSIALLSGYNADQRVSAVVRFDGVRSGATDSHEVELILRGSYRPHDQTLYECNLGYSGPLGWYSQIMLLDGGLGVFREVGSLLVNSLEVHDGDVFTAEIVGNSIRTYLNGVAISAAVDNTIATGQPGVGFFWRGTENVDDLAFTEMCATSL